MYFVVFFFARTQHACSMHAACMHEVSGRVLRDVGDGPGRRERDRVKELGGLREARAHMLTCHCVGFVGGSHAGGH